MNEEQIRAMLADIIDNMEAPNNYPSHTDFKREWLFTVSDTAAAMGKEVILTA